MIVIIGFTPTEVEEGGVRDVQASVPRTAPSGSHTLAAGSVPILAVLIG